MLRGSVLLATAAGAAAFAPAALPLAGPRATAAHKGAGAISMQRFQGGLGNQWDTEGADWAVNGGIFGAVGDVIWAREAEVKHGRICMLAATGAIVQDLYTFPFMDKWYQGEKMWGLHEAAIKSGAMWQVLFFVGLLEIPFLLKLANGSVDGTGDLGFDPLGLAEDQDQFNANQLKEVKNGRLAMIAISGMTHHYFLTGKGPIDFITQIPNFRSCAAAAVTTQLCV
ncbi:light-harvesting complex protein Lhcc2 [Baffinella frigidus]|nr:light-harvesting complex protein Lhcc2 [Cryptophyta sp. CCMP2293]